MNVSTRFSVALHALTLLASQPDEALTSEFIAGSINTNPAFVRRLMGSLRAAGLVTSQPGNRGGWELAADPERLNLAEVRRAVDEGAPFALHAKPPNVQCPVGRNIQRALTGVYARAERAMEAELGRTSVAGLLRAVRRGR
jgi:Rrf2 family protein